MLDIDLSDLTNPVVVHTSTLAAGAVVDLTARGDRALAAASTALVGLDLSQAPFPVEVVPAAAVAVLAEDDLGALGLGTRDASDVTTGGTLATFTATRTPVPSLTRVNIDVQRMRGFRHQAIIAAGARGLAIVDATTPTTPHLRSLLDVGGFASDVRVASGVAFVATSHGIVAVDLTNLDAPTVLYRVGGAAEHVLVDGASLVFAGSGTSGASLSFGQVPGLVLTSSSVADGGKLQLSASPRL